jgi:hypothetical protein
MLSSVFALRREVWKIGTTHKAWRDFIAGRFHLDPQVVENIRRVQDPEFVRRLDAVENFWSNEV